MHHYSATGQTNSFSRYVEDLAVPKDNGYNSEFLDLCNIRHNIFHELCEQNSNGPHFSSQNICDAIQQLHSVKATYELGLAAEHFEEFSCNSDSLSYKLSTAISNWSLGNTFVYPSEDTTHLGFEKELKENNLNIDARISIPRRTLLSLMNTGLHGTNGINQQTSYKIYQSYVIPRLVYGMEILPLNQRQLDIMTRFHTKTLRNIQSLPTKTATGSVLMLLGALTIEAEIHKRQLISVQCSFL
ncbi:unnamed protein product [Mytilus coruscus]|uniref:Uncharacterized protein n=1 Tax=Mytilus coruscus TaxID=42192 RepID=A0A6J8EWQ4_MYTCO|nr:unnamed protein product [Mytilus coruscus]